jgi:hypothetical protein
MLVNKALIEGDLWEVYRLRKEGYTWEGPKNSYNGKYLTSDSFRFQTKHNHELAGLLLEVLNFDIKKGECSLKWEWSIVLTKEVNPTRLPIPAVFADFHGQYIAIDCMCQTQEKPTIVVSRKSPTNYQFSIQKYDGDQGFFQRSYYFNRQIAIDVLFLLNICENTPINI